MVKIQGERWEASIRKEVRQRSSLPLPLFNLYLEKANNGILEETENIVVIA